MDRVDLEDWLSETITDSIDMDWRSSDAALLITARLEEAGLLEPLLELVSDREWIEPLASGNTQAATAA